MHIMSVISDWISSVQSYQLYGMPMLTMGLHGYLQQAIIVPDGQRILMSTLLPKFDKFFKAYHVVNVAYSLVVEHI
jgi:hypothetical protein